uniref:Si:ch211-210c8.7 n=1 Tax=Xiphophorus maculatus TaxID=8083 RepID=M4AZ18_XIPMA
QFVLFHKRICFSADSTLGPTAFPKQEHQTVHYAVVFAMLVTLGVVAFILYRYMCSNKGDYRTTGEPAPGDHFYDESNTPSASEKKEYFI